MMELEKIDDLLETKRSPVMIATVILVGTLLFVTYSLIAVIWAGLLDHDLLLAFIFIEWVTCVLLVKNLFQKINFRTSLEMLIDALKESWESDKEET